MSEQLPYQRHSDTSKAAAAGAAPGAKTLRMAVLRFLKQRKSGATDLEIQEHLAMDGNMERPRRRELVLAGLVRDSGKRRLTPSLRKSVVWEVSEGVQSLASRTASLRAKRVKGVDTAALVQENIRLREKVAELQANKPKRQRQPVAKSPAGDLA